MNIQHALIVGGSSGLGLELAARLSGQGYRVTATGKRESFHHPALDHYESLPLHLWQTVSSRVAGLLSRLPPVDLLIYAAGYPQQKKLVEMSDDEIHEMNCVVLMGLQYVLKGILLDQGGLAGMICVTSTSQFTPRPLEVPYASAMSGRGMTAVSIRGDDQVRKVLVAAPGGMDTPFWRDQEDRIPDLLDPGWVADQILAYYNRPRYRVTGSKGESFKFRFIVIPRSPNPEVEVREEY